MANEITGKVLLIESTQEIPTKSGKTFFKRVIVLDCTRYDANTGAKYENFPSIEFTGENNCTLLDQYKEGDEVVINFSLEGHAYTNNDGITKYFTSARGFRIEQAQQPIGNAVYDTRNTAPTNEQVLHAMPKAQPKAPQIPTAVQDDLPF